MRVPHMDSFLMASSRAFFSLSTGTLGIGSPTKLMFMELVLWRVRLFLKRFWARAGFLAVYLIVALLPVGDGVALMFLVVGAMVVTVGAIVILAMGYGGGAVVRTLWLNIRMGWLALLVSSTGTGCPACDRYVCANNGAALDCCKLPLGFCRSSDCPIDCGLSLLVNRYCCRIGCCCVACWLNINWLSWLGLLVAMAKVWPPTCCVVMKQGWELSWAVETAIVPG